MKILFVCQYYYPEQFKINDITFELVKQGHEVEVLTGQPNYPEGDIYTKYKKQNIKKEIINGVKVHRSRLYPRKSGNINLALNYISFAFFSSLKALKIKRDFDVIFLYQLSPITMGIPAILLKRLSKKPMLLYCFDLWPESIVSGGLSSRGVSYNILLKISKWIYSKADKILLSSSSFTKYFNDILKNEIKKTHLPIYAEEIFENVDSIENGYIDLVFAGNIGEMQSVETIIYAANELSHLEKLKIHIVGDGSSKLRCEELSMELELTNVEFYGRKPLKDMPKYYSLADGFLVTLKSNEKISYTMPGKVQTYMAAGKPVIGAINGETKKIIKKSRCGFCVEAEDYKSLAQTIQNFVENYEDYKSLGKNGKEYYKKNYIKNKFIEKLIKELTNIGGRLDV